MAQSPPLHMYIFSFISLHHQPDLLLQYIISTVAFKIEPESATQVPAIFGGRHSGERERGKWVCHRAEDAQGCGLSWHLASARPRRDNWGISCTFKETHLPFVNPLSIIGCRWPTLGWEWGWGCVTPQGGGF